MSGLMNSTAGVLTNSTAATDTIRITIISPTWEGAVALLMLLVYGCCMFWLGRMSK